MKILEGVLLSNHTTFHIGGPAKYFGEVFTLDDLLQGLQFAKKNNLELFVLSGGSNVLISDAGLNSLVLKLSIVGIEKVLDTTSECILKVASGEVWDNVVKQAVSEGLWGIENLSHIPGKVGGVPVQNVGAYGQEAKDTIVSVDVYDIKEAKLKTLMASELNFGYRKSIFNTTQKGRYIILYTRFKLSKDGKPNLEYRDLRLRFVNNPKPTINEVREAVISIRDKKFPFPNSPKTGNSGSWFKNSILNEREFSLFKDKIASSFPEEILERVKKYELELTNDEGTKIPSAFLLEICGLKGLQAGGAIINPSQPLVILNKTGKAKALDVLEIVKKVRAEVFEKTGINLNVEPELVGFSKEELVGVK